MAGDSRRGFLSSLFGSRDHKKQEETAALESRQRLEERIQLILAEQAHVPELIKEETQTVLVAQEEVETDIELLPITASVFNRKGPIPASFLPECIEATRFYAANDRW